MSSKIKISCTIITFNEASNLEDCLTSIKNVVDEIIIVDSFSTDDTELIANSYNVKFIKNAFKGHIQQKNFAMKQASNDVILSLDADERLSKEAAESLKKLKEFGLQADAYSFNRLNNYCGKWIKHCGWYPDRKVRLWNRNKGKWGGENPHDAVIMQPASLIKNIDNNILHFTYRSIEAHISQIDKFTTIAAKEAFDKGKRSSVFVHIVCYPMWLFIKNYFFKLGILDGFYGFIICINGAYYKYLKYLKMKVLEKSNQ